MPKGRKEVKLVLLTIHNGTGTNLNGLDWHKNYVEDNLDTLSGMPIVARFLDEDKSVLYDHGDIENVVLVGGTEETYFKDTENVGVVEHGAIEKVTVNGKEIEALVGYGFIYTQNYPNLYNVLKDGKVKSSIVVNVSEYDGEPTDEHRIPKKFTFTSTALLGVKEADENCVILELNNKEDNEMTEEQIVAIVKKALAENNDVAEKDKRIKDLEVEVENLKAEKAQYEKDSAAGKAELEELKKNEKISKLDAELSEFSDEEKKVAEDEINAFKADPMNHSVEEITNKIYKSAFKAHKESNKNLDIFGNVGIEVNSKNDATGGADAYDALLSATRGLR